MKMISIRSFATLATVATMMHHTLGLQTTRVNSSPKNFKYVGSTKPFETFDPLGIASTYEDDLIKYSREAELQHGRIAMVSFVFFPIYELFVDPGHVGINALSNTPQNTQFAWLAFFGVYEFARMFKGYENPFITKDSFVIRDDHEPGQLFPCVLEEDRMNKELNNGRLAMLAMSHILLTEFIFQTPTF